MSATTTRQCDDCGGGGVRTIEGKRFACPRCLTVGAYEVAPPGTIAGLEAEAARLRGENLRLAVDLCNAVLDLGRYVDRLPVPNFQQFEGGSYTGEDIARFRREGYARMIRVFGRCHDAPAKLARLKTRAEIALGLDELTSGSKGGDR